MILRAVLMLAGLSLMPDLFAQATVFQEGKHYQRIEPAQATGSKDKIEVVEVFSYACRGCALFEPYVAKWKQRMPAEAVFTYMPAAFHPSWQPFARAFYAAEALGIQKQSHEAMFKALHVEKRVLNSDQDIARFYQPYGKSAEQMLAAMNSFGVSTKLNRALQTVPKYRVERTPTLVVNGKYRITTESAGGADKVFDVVNFLVAKEAAELKAKAAATALSTPTTAAPKR